MNKKKNVPTGKDHLPPRRISISADCSTTEEMSCSLSEDGDGGVRIEEFVRDEVKHWLAMHGSKLYSLEASKFLANTKKGKK